MGARESVNSSIFLWLWYRCAGSLQVAYFSFASLHSNTDSWLQNTVIFLTAYLFYICRYAYFSWIMFASSSGISLWPFMELRNLVWKRTYIFAFPPFPSLLFLYLMSTYTTAVPCLWTPGCSASFHQPLNTHLIQFSTSRRGQSKNKHRTRLKQQKHRPGLSI